jgi:hypothetical protein
MRAQSGSDHAKIGGQRFQEITDGLREGDHNNQRAAAFSPLGEERPQRARLEPCRPSFQEPAFILRDAALSRGSSG